MAKRAPVPKTPEEVILAKRVKLRDRALAKSLLEKVAVLVLALLLIFGVFFGLAPMKGSDMEPRLSSGDLLVYYRLEKNFQRNDVVILEREGVQYVGRLIGFPGETIKITGDGKIIIDGNTIFESDIYAETVPVGDEISYPLTLAQDEYFLLADKRNTAKDSRYFGPIKKTEIKGNVITAIRRVNI